MRAAAAVILAIWSTWLFSQPALAGKRVALVIGNSAYQNVNSLANPANDSGAMSAIFKDSGFADDVARANMTAILNRNGIGDVESL